MDQGAGVGPYPSVSHMVVYRKASSMLGVHHHIQTGIHNRSANCQLPVEGHNTHGLGLQAVSTGNRTSIDR